MQDYQERRQLRKFFASRFVLAILFVLTLGAGIASLQALARSWEAGAERARAQERLQGTLQKKDASASQAVQMQNGYGIEREARDKLNLRKPGEEVVIIRDELATATSAADSEQSSWFTRMVDMFKHLF